MKQLLFPRGFRIAGWIIFIPAAIMGILFMCGVTSGLSGVAETLYYDVTIIGMALGAVFIVCSKEPKENEMTHSIRLTSLLKSFYVYMVVLVVCTLFVNGTAYLDFMAANLVLFPTISVVIFRCDIHRQNKLGQNKDN